MRSFGDSETGKLYCVINLAPVVEESPQYQLSSILTKRRRLAEPSEEYFEQQWKVLATFSNVVAVHEEDAGEAPVDPPEDAREDEIVEEEPIPLDNSDLDDDVMETLDYDDMAVADLPDDDTQDRSQPESTQYDGTQGDGTRDEGIQDGS